MPYLQMLLGGYKAARGPSGTSQMAQQAQGMAPHVNLPGQPGSQSTTRRAGRAVGEAALGTIPVVGGAAQALGGIYNRAKDQGDQQGYLRKLLAMNPDLAPPGTLDLEDVPKGGEHDKLRHGFQAASTAVASYFGGPAGGAAAGLLTHGKEKKEAEWLAKQQAAVKARNAEKIAQYNDSMAQDAEATGQEQQGRAAHENPFGAAQGPDPAAMQRMMPYLLHLLGPQAGQYLRGLMPQAQQPAPQSPLGPFGGTPLGRL